MSVPIHLDVVVLDATLEVDGRRCSTRGRYVLDADRRVTDDAAGLSRTSPRDATRRRSTRSRGAFGARLLDVHSDPDHHRSVFTLAGAPGELGAARAQTAPRSGRAASTSTRTTASTRASARSTSRRSSTSTPPTAAPPAPRRWCSATCSASELELPGVPVRRARRRAHPRASCAAAARQRSRSGSRPASSRPTSGRRGCTRPPARCWSRARPPLVAFNVELAPPATLEDARAIAARIREGGPGGARVGPGDRPVARQRAASPRSRPTSRTTGRRRSPTVVAAIAPPRHAGRAELVGLAPRGGVRRLPRRPDGREPPDVEDALAGRSARPPRD